MSTSWGRGGALPSYSSQTGHWQGLGGGAQDIPPFFVPSYLRGSKHAEKLQEAYKAKLAAQREFRSQHSSNAGSLSTSSSSANLRKAASHYPMTHEVIERAPVFVDEPVSPWPTRWNDSDKFAQLDIEDGGRQAKFTGTTQKTHDEAASVRADSAMPRQCGIYYYEVTVVSKGKDGRMIGVGFSGSKVALSRIPGWEPDSFAYHGDDGQIFNNTTSGKNYGPKFGTLDVIGCGINFRTNTAFFTKNGHMLGTAFRDLKPNVPYFPTIGMKKPGETLRANFGQEPFAFDIDKMVQDEKAAIQEEIKQTKFTPSAASAPDETQFIHRLISQYLAHDGYVETTQAFAEEIVDEARALANDDDATIPYKEAIEDMDALNRQKIRAAILEGDIDKALKHTQAYYPSVLRDNENIYFKLRCRKFIEMIRDCNELNTQSQPAHASKRSAASSIKKRNSTATDEYDFQMELDEQFGVNNPTPSLDDLDDEDDIEDKRAKLVQLTANTIAYGQELGAEFANDPRREVKQALKDTFALIAYENAKESSLAPLLDVEGRIPVAEELNSAILERVVQQAEALVTELAEDGGPGAFINVRRDFLQ
ncbi:hypothetical protein SLS59_006413 [Nothophoma quercina]|uniref:Protein SSH4 n=1 Tax=Nothophoma quercina TaxID=749835 RepID=A0ABR3R4P9_9PLEO